MLMINQQRKITDILNEILQLRTVLDITKSKLQAMIDDQGYLIVKKELKWSGKYWTFIAYADALNRLGLIIVQNFHFVETIGTLAVTRYVFEMLIWLRSLRDDQRYGLVYYAQIIAKQIYYYQDFANKLEKEGILLEMLGKEEGDRLKAVYEIIHAKTDKDLVPKAVEKAHAQISEETDRKARRLFCIYADQAKTNGHGYQAHLI